MPRNHRDAFISVKIEGALLSPDLLERIVIAPEEVEGLLPSDYHLVGNERLNEVINRSWNRLTTLWQAFKETRSHLAENDWATGITRDRWLLPLFQELGYGRLLLSKAQEIGGKTFPISHSWQNSPIHLLGFRIPLDRRTPGVAGAATSSPHSMVQEFLNRSDEHLWGLVSNGLTLRILRDNASISRQQYIEFDLEGIMEGELYSDFVLLWLLCHQSRFEADNPTECWLEKWGQTVQEEGSRVLERLRVGVKETIVTLGQGFLEHPTNGNLREALQSGRLDKQEYFRQLLRLVYRLIFLCTAEDRGLLFFERTSELVRTRYEKYYSLRRLRELAEKRRGTDHHDLYRQLKLVMISLGQAEGAPALGLPALGSYLWSERAMPELMESEIKNRELLSALRSLTLHQTVERRIRVDFRHLGAEEMGSVYESLLELHPELHIEARNFELKEAAGSERKTTGSYYTPVSLINCLLDSALDPVLEEAARQPDPEEAILNLKICDPACGSGQFLVGAARRVAYRLAAIRCGEDDPPPAFYRPALRQVIARCIYGVDINEMAVELCKVNLWLESLEPGMPLCFLDHHIKCGNSLLGTTPALLAKGIPDEAFVAIEGDNKKDVSDLKRQNRNEQVGQMSLFESSISYQTTLMSQYMRQIDETLERDLKEQASKEKRYHDLVESSDYRHQVLNADAWCASFAWVKDQQKMPVGLTQDVFNFIKREPQKVDPQVINEIERLTRQYQFFHWHLAFPDVFQTHAEKSMLENTELGWSGGFDIVLGNPPWERIKLQEKEWFASIVPEIAQTSNATARRSMIAQLVAESPGIYSAFSEERRKAEGESHFSRNSGYFPLCGRGDINTYAIFCELMKNLINPKGRVGCVVPSGIATDDTTKLFFQAIMETKTLVSLYDFENRAKLFSAVDSRMKFCLLTLTGPARFSQEGAEFVFFAHRVEDLDDKERRFKLSAEDLTLLNPNTHTCPVFRSRRDAELTKAIYRRVPIFIKEGPPEENPWGIRFRRIFDMNKQETLKICKNQAYEGFIRMYEAKLFHQYNHRWGTYSLKNVNLVSDEYRKDPGYLIQTRNYIPNVEMISRLKDLWDYNWLIGFRDITNATNERTCIMTILPISGTDFSVRLLLPSNINEKYICLIANFNSFVLDYIARQMMGGTHLSDYITKQLPILTPQIASRHILFIEPRILELVYTAWDLKPFVHDYGYDGPPFIWDEDRRFHIRCELDAAFFHLYGIARDDVDYIMETFPIVKRKDEATYGSFRTKETIMAIYDQMQAAIDSGQPYQTPLNPLPGPPMDVDGNFVSIYCWDRDNWPPDIHSMHPEWEESLLSAWFAICQKRWSHFEDDQIFPWDGREGFVYALIPYLIQKKPGEKFEYYRDTALLASHSERCKTLLLDEELYNEYCKVLSDVTWLDFPEMQRVRPREIREKLQNKRIILTNSSSGASIINNDVTLPPLPKELEMLLPLFLNAGDNLEKMQRQTLDAKAANVNSTCEEVANVFSKLMVV